MVTFTVKILILIAIFFLIVLPIGAKLYAYCRVSPAVRSQPAVHLVASVNILISGSASELHLAHHDDPTAMINEKGNRRRHAGTSATHGRPCGSRTTKLYDHSKDPITRAEVERIQI